MTFRYPGILYTFGHSAKRLSIPLPAFVVQFNE
jgi:hypothetical protein